MLSSRGARLPRLAGAAFAESSKQAERRAALPHLHSIGSVSQRARDLSTSTGRYTAMAFASQPHDEAETHKGFGIDHRPPPPPPMPVAGLAPEPEPEPAPLAENLALSNGRSRRPNPGAGAMTRPADGGPPPPYDGDDLRPVERFRRRVVYDPVGAMLWLREWSQPDLFTITTKDLRVMIYNLVTQVHPSPQLRASIDPIAANEALRIVRALLFAEPHRVHKRPEASQFIGYNLKGRTLRGLFQIAIVFGAQQFIAELFAERMSEFIRTGRELLNWEWLVKDLAGAGEWQLATDLFPGPGANHPTDKYAPQVGGLPASLYTPRLVSILMTANLVLQQPWRAVQLFSLIPPNEAGEEALCGLIKAHLQLGDVASAKRAVHVASVAGIDPDNVQLALLEGHRMLGSDPQLAERVRHDLNRLGLAPRVNLANALGKLCIDSGDLDGAEGLIAEIYELERTGQLEEQRRELDETALLALSIASRRGNIEGVKQAWALFSHRPESVTDKVVAQLCRALIRLGRGQESALILEAAVTHNHSRSPWPIPSAFVPSILTGNAVLEAVCVSHNYQAMLDVLVLMRAGGIEPDSRSVVLALKLAKTTLLSSPTALTQLLEGILERTRDQPTVDQINVILTEVVRIASRQPKYQEKYLEAKPGRTSLDSPSSGIETRGALRHMLAKQIEILNDSGQRSTGKSLSNRLLYDALAMDGVWPVQSVQKTWQSFILRGFRPKASHYLTLLQAYARIGAMTEAEQTYALATDTRQSEHMPPTPEVERLMLTSLVQGWAHAGNLQAARRVYMAIRTLPCGVDATALEVLVNSHVMADQPSRAVTLARQDIASVDPNERLVVTVAHAIRRDRDVPGCIYFISHFTQRWKAGAAPTDAFCEGVPGHGATWELTPKLLGIVRKALNYLNKRPVDSMNDRTREALILARRMLADDEVARPFPRGRRRLGVRVRERLADAMDISRNDRITAAMAADAARQTYAGKGEL
ncbi:uncharacterized protein CcaverHIS019_0112530 [Cutaneotrichosporon cavernicola]|uniref:Pentacotripeptide-repeat region of PRORP domain-containing protein n=1 Tax=Cutaneotrichosporon cavernicola TaxID=279322 RepID=A0AA48L0Q9_9TREE|nr:uncharacterized protein CcaverHIS019_0112530 [Cutaneotrichosporon cavernicola]BEI88535.1 hypothetical protein CcaverHIS019_0112530 [Cutaneotrichosporon cavernicola]BEI96308.1 hypothetical protein CcaverHIS631_0112570 [Cutaneotrichosporon cavernicola]BEJ04079.1 hypothetical protein CcaverHIS641_0112540 [Cutaneotrichosporon cavernicola]